MKNSTKRIRKIKTSIEVENEQNNDDQQVREVIEEFTLFQQTKKRYKGVELKVENKVNQLTQEQNLLPSKLDSNFTVQTKVSDTNPQLEKYLEEKLNKKKVDENINIITKEDDVLYEVPSHLKVDRPKIQTANIQFANGIVEIELPIENKIKNIEETENAKRKILTQANLKKKSQDIDRTILNARYGYVQKEFLPDAQPDLRNTNATDQLLLDKFKRSRKY
eukprot:TRINITY_DN8951_c0_g1_i1.p1 TRINITY_DN8951_c0_g1~~TRINITY_DN8951_c0_g1_i1.p1  ORF type:complete len:230 (-),score=80.20 TRINITY_DN8951_c0_g1_i1:13-675(-)